MVSTKNNFQNSVRIIEILKGVIIKSKFKRLNEYIFLAPFLLFNHGQKIFLLGEISLQTCTLLQNQQLNHQSFNIKIKQYLSLKIIFILKEILYIIKTIRFVLNPQNI